MLNLKCIDIQISLQERHSRGFIHLMLEINITKSNFTANKGLLGHVVFGFLKQKENKKTWRKKNWSRTLPNRYSYQYKLLIILGKPSTISQSSHSSRRRAYCAKTSPNQIYSIVCPFCCLPFPEATRATTSCRQSPEGHCRQHQGATNVFKPSSFRKMLPLPPMLDAVNVLTALALCSKLL